MKSRLNADFYTSPYIFNRESTKVFGEVWQFAGISAEIKENNSFVVRRMGAKQVLLQRIDSQIRAFENVCPHRLTPIQWESQGVRPLVCRYHGWSFHPDGRIKNIPFEKEAYRFSKRQRSTICLKQFEVREIGQFIFVHVGKPFPIEKQISKAMIAQLVSISNYFDEIYEKRTLVRRFNWKLAYENLRDILHPRFVHRNSLAKVVDFGMPRINDYEPFEKFRLKGLSWGGADAPLTVTDESWHDEIKRWPCQDAYYNWLVFPNLHIASATAGRSFTIEHHIPISPDETHIHVYMMTASRKRSTWDPSEVLKQHFDASDTILNEDYSVLEKIQEAMRSTQISPKLGAYEWWNLRIERWYLKKIGFFRSSIFLADILYFIKLPHMLAIYIKKFGIGRLGRRLWAEVVRSDPFK